MFYNSEVACNCIFFLLLPHANACRGLHGQFRSGKEQQQHSARKVLKSCAVFLRCITLNYWTCQQSGFVCHQSLVITGWIVISLLTCKRALKRPFTRKFYLRHRSCYSRRFILLPSCKRTLWLCSHSTGRTFARLKIYAFRCYVHT